MCYDNFTRKEKEIKNGRDFGLPHGQNCLAFYKLLLNDFCNIFFSLFSAKRCVKMQKRKAKLIVWHVCSIKWFQIEHLNVEVKENASGKS